MNDGHTVSVHALIKWALDEHTEREIDSFPIPEELEELYPDTSAFRERFFREIAVRKKAIQKKSRKPLRMIRRTLLVAAVLASLLFATLMTNASVRSVVVNTIIEWTGRDMGIRYEIQGEPLSAIPDGYGAHYIPDGYVYMQENSANEKNLFSRIYEKSETDFIVIDVTVLENASMIWMDNEHTVYEKIEFNGTTAYLGTFIERDGYTLNWAQNGMEHYIYAAGNISLSDVSRIAENIY